MTYKPFVLAAADGGAGQVYNNGVGILSTTTGIDGKATGTTTLYTVPAGKQAIVLTATFRLTNSSAVISVATAGIGVASGEDDIITAAALTNLSATNKGVKFDPQLGFKVAQATEVIKLGIDVAYVATTATLAVDLFGYLI